MLGHLALAEGTSQLSVSPQGPSRSHTNCRALASSFRVPRAPSCPLPSWTGINLFLAQRFYCYFILLPKGNEDVSCSGEVLELLQHVSVLDLPQLSLQAEPVKPYWAFTLSLFPVIPVPKDFLEAGGFL